MHTRARQRAMPLGVARFHIKYKIAECLGVSTMHFTWKNILFNQILKCKSFFHPNDHNVTVAVDYSQHSSTVLFVLSCIGIDLKNVRSKCEIEGDSSFNSLRCLGRQH